MPMLSPMCMNRLFDAETILDHRLAGQSEKQEWAHLEGLKFGAHLLALLDGGKRHDFASGAVHP